MQQCQLFLSQEIILNNEILQKSYLFSELYVCFTIRHMLKEVYVFKAHWATSGQRRICVGEKYVCMQPKLEGVLCINIFSMTRYKIYCRANQE